MFLQAIRQVSHAAIHLMIYWLVPHGCHLNTEYQQFDDDAALRLRLSLGVEAGLP
jgi:hypothetical protein